MDETLNKGLPPRLRPEEINKRIQGQRVYEPVHKIRRKAGRWFNFETREQLEWHGKFLGGLFEVGSKVEQETWLEYYPEPELSLMDRENTFVWLVPDVGRGVKDR